MGLMLRRMCMMGASAIPTPPLIKTVTGTLLHITDALAKSAKKFVATLEPIQDLHGQDAPYPAGGGKNKFDGVFIQGSAIKLANNARIVSQNTIPVVSGKTYTFSASDYNSFMYALNSAEASGLPFPSSAYSYCGTPDTWISGAITFTATHDGYVAIVVKKPNDSAIAPSDVSAIKMQFEEGSTATAWSPYSNICPITGHTGANVVRTGKNLFDPQFYTNTPYNAAVGSILNMQKSNDVTVDNNVITYPVTTAWGGGGFKTAPLSEGTYYVRYDLTASDDDSKFRGTWYVVGNDNVIKYKETLAVYAGTKSKILNVSDGDYIVINVASVSIQTLYFTDYRIGIGSVAEEFEPFQGETYKIEFPDEAGTVYGGTLTNEDGEWKLRVTMASAEFDGSSDEEWSMYGSSSASAYAMQISVPNIKFIQSTVTAWSNYLPSVDNNKTWGNYDLFVSVNASGLKTGIRSITTVEAWVSYLAENPLQIVYELATPIEYTLTESQALTLLKGENNVWCDGSDDLELQYYAKAEETTP